MIHSLLMGKMRPKERQEPARVTQAHDSKTRPSPPPPSNPESERVSCSVLSDSFAAMDCSPPGSSVRGILQARTLSGFPFPSPGDLPDSGIEPGFPALQADSLPSEPPGKPTAPNKKQGTHLGSSRVRHLAVITSFESSDSLGR